MFSCLTTTAFSGSVSEESPAPSSWRMLPGEPFRRQGTSAFTFFMVALGESGETLMLANRLLLATLFHSDSLPFQSKFIGLSADGILVDLTVL
jgi:hypothetical protein